MVCRSDLLDAFGHLNDRDARDYSEYRQFFQQFSLSNASDPNKIGINSITFPKQAGTQAATIGDTAEGAEGVLDYTPYTNVTCVPKKIMIGFIITKEVIEDSLLPIQQDQLIRMSMRAANKVDKDKRQCSTRMIKDVVMTKEYAFPYCVTVIDAGATHSRTATGISVFMDGARVTLSGSNGPEMGTEDISHAKMKIETGSYMPDTLYCSPVHKRGLERLPHFTAAMFWGKPGYQEGLMATPGKFGEILGLDAFVSVNCTVDTAYVLSRGRTANILGQFSPMGLKVIFNDNFVQFRRETSSDDRYNYVCIIHGGD